MAKYLKTPRPLFLLASIALSSNAFADTPPAALASGVDLNTLAALSQNAVGTGQALGNGLANSQLSQALGALGRNAGAGATTAVASGASNLKRGIDSHLSPKETVGTSYARDWTRRNDAPGRGSDGAVIYSLGASLPSVVCAPMMVCLIRLQEGEVVQQIDVGDATRWRVVPALSGSGASQTTSLVVKPTDSGLETNMSVATDRRTYIVKLVSRINDWMPLVAFTYPEDDQAAMARYKAETAQAAAKILPGTSQNIAALDFNFKISGDSPNWKPIRVYTDGQKTYIQFSGSMLNADAPALVAIGVDKSQQLVNYRVKGDRYEVDTVIARAALISGVGYHQVKVEIERRK